MANNKFILFQVPSADGADQNQLFPVRCSDIAEIEAVIAFGAKEVGRLQTVLSQADLVNAMSANALQRELKLKRTIINIKKELERGGWL